jgi:hypothetical protein
MLTELAWCGAKGFAGGDQTMAARDILERFLAQGRDFERTFLDDDWSRMKQHFAADAVYEALGPGGERFVGRAELLAALRRAITNFDRRCDSRTLVTTAGLFCEGVEVKREWACTFTLGGAPDLRIEGSERAVYRGELIELLQERLMPESRLSLNAWIAAFGTRLAPPGGKVAVREPTA